MSASAAVQTKCSRVDRNLLYAPSSGAFSATGVVLIAMLTRVETRSELISIWAQTVTAGPRSTDPCHSSKPSRTGFTANSGQVYLHRCSSAQLIPVPVCFQNATDAGPPSTESSHSRRTRRTDRTANSGQVYFRGYACAQLIPAFPRRSNCWQAPSRLLPLLKASTAQPTYLIYP